MRLGELHLELGRPEQAESYFAAAAAINPEDSHALLGLGRISLERGDLEASRGYLERAAQARKNHREVHAILVQVYDRLEQPYLRNKAIRRATESDINTFVRDLVLYRARQEGTSAAHLAQQGKWLLYKRELDEAIAKLRLAHETRPEYIDARIDLAQALILKGIEEEGLAHLDSVEAMFPGSIDVEQLVAAIRSQRGKAD